MIKKIILLLLALAAIYGAVMSPYSLTETLDKKAKLEQVITEKANAENSRNSARDKLMNSKNAFESQRNFSVEYYDLYKIKLMLDAVSGVSFYSLAEVDPDNNYALGANLNVEDYADNSVSKPRAVQLTLYAENTADGLSAINTMELPLVSITTEEPGRIELIFLTGGDN